MQFHFQFCFYWFLQVSLIFTFSHFHKIMTRQETRRIKNLTFLWYSLTTFNHKRLLEHHKKKSLKWFFKQQTTTSWKYTQRVKKWWVSQVSSLSDRKKFYCYFFLIVEIIFLMSKKLISDIFNILVVFSHKLVKKKLIIFSIHSYHRHAHQYSKALSCPQRYRTKKWE